MTPTHVGAVARTPPVVAPTRRWLEHEALANTSNIVYGRKLEGSNAYSGDSLKMLLGNM